MGQNDTRFIGVYYNRRVFPLCAYCKKIMWHGQKSSVMHKCKYTPKDEWKHKDLTDASTEVFHDAAQEHWENYFDAIMHGERLVARKVKVQKVE